MKKFFGYKISPYIVLSAFMLFAAISLRMHDISDRSLWLDEAMSVHNSKGTLAETIFNTQHANSSPIVYPVLLHFVQEFDSSPMAVRLPSAIASILVIFVVLSLPRVGIDKRVAFLAALLLTLSASQIRYAQEVREYSLSVLVASVMIYTYFLYLRNGNRRYLFFAIMFIAPLIQYGLVLFAVALLVSIGVERLYNQNWRKAISSLILPSVFLVAGGIISAWLTLHFQWSESTSAFYLSSNYFEAGYGDIKALAGFIGINTYKFFEFVVPPLAIGLAFPAFSLAFYYCVMGIQCERNVMQIALIAVVAILIVISASIAHIYPFGGIRQILFLSPVVALLFATSFLSLFRGEKIKTWNAWFVICIAFSIFAGAADIYRQKPYGEVEDIQRVMNALDKDVAPKDAVYIYYLARPALDYYKMERENFFYGESHRQDPEKYIEDILGLKQPESGKLWLVFSHSVRDEEEYIVEHIASQWKLKKVVEARKSSLYMGVRQ